MCFLFFFFNDTATTEIYTLSLHDALPISGTFSSASLTCAAHESQVMPVIFRWVMQQILYRLWRQTMTSVVLRCRSEEHTSELQSQSNLVCRLLLEKKKNTHLCNTSRDRRD